MAPDDAPPDAALVAWALGTLHAALLVLLLVAATHFRGTLGPRLAEAGTLQGLAAFALLWALSWWSARRGLEDLPLATPARRLAPQVLLRGLTYGGAVGGGFLLGLAALLLVSVRPELTLGALVFAGAALGVALSFAIVVGGLVGVVFAALDLSLLLAARRWAREGFFPGSPLPRR